MRKLGLLSGAVAGLAALLFLPACTSMQPIRNDEGKVVRYKEKFDPHRTAGAAMSAAGIVLNAGTAFRVPGAGTAGNFLNREGIKLMDRGGVVSNPASLAMLLPSEMYAFSALSDIPENLEIYKHTSGFDRENPEIFFYESPENGTVIMYDAGGDGVFDGAIVTYTENCKMRIKKEGPFLIKLDVRGGRDHLFDVSPSMQEAAKQREAARLTSK